jgi:HEAT repeat protein
MEANKGEGQSEHSPATEETSKTPGMWRVMLFSFFVVPLAIAIGGVALFTGVFVLTTDEPDTLSLLDDVRHGYSNKRWQAAYHLVTMLDGPNAVPTTPEITAALNDAFENTDPETEGAVRQYLALAMGCTGSEAFVAPLLAALESDPSENNPFIIRALGRLGYAQAAEALTKRIGDASPAVRLESVIALGAIGDPASTSALNVALADTEVNVRWDAAIALAKLGDDSGQQTLLQLMDRSYLSGFDAVDPNETNRILQVAVQAAAMLHRPALDAAINKVATSDENMEVRRIASDVLNNPREETVEDESHVHQGA